MVALPEQYALMMELRNALPKSIPLWLNAAKEQGVVYNAADRQRLEQIDPNFVLNLHDYPTFGKACRAGGYHGRPRGNCASLPLCRRADGMHLFATAVTAIGQNTAACPQQKCDCYIGHIQFSREEEYQRWLEERLIWRGL